MTSQREVKESTAETEATMRPQQVPVNLYETSVDFPKESTTKDFTVPDKVTPPKKKAQPGDDRDGY